MISRKEMQNEGGADHPASLPAWSYHGPVDRRPRTASTEGVPGRAERPGGGTRHGTSRRHELRRLHGPRAVSRLPQQADRRGLLGLPASTPNAVAPRTSYVRGASNFGHFSLLFSSRLGMCDKGERGHEGSNPHRSSGNQPRHPLS